jgi:hypothetical protein
MAGPHPKAFAMIGWNISIGIAHKRTKDIVKTVSAQIARQLENLRLLKQAEEYQTKAEDASRRLTRLAWDEFLDSSPKSIGFVYNQNEVVPKNEVELPHSPT